jgi:Tfp pilus assembly protein PilF
MDEKLDFRFTLQKPPPGPLIEMSAQEVEARLLKRLDEEKAQPADALWQLARFYQQSKQADKGLACLRQALSHMPDPEKKAHCVLAMGQLMETVQDYQSAVRYYKEALALEPVQNDIWYFINNNLGFSLNTLRRFAEGESYCRRALEITPERPNAHKNLGIALAGQSDFAGAARCFVSATQANAADPRAFHLLLDLLKEHPELEFEFRPAADFCRKAVETVGQKAAQLKPVVYRGWKKRLLLLGLNLRSAAVRAWKRVRTLFNRSAPIIPL